MAGGAEITEETVSHGGTGTRRRTEGRSMGRRAQHARPPSAIERPYPFVLFVSFVVEESKLCASP
jgi:hypothetical protein